MPQHEQNGAGRPVDAAIDDLILDILGDGGRAPAATAAALPQLPRGTPLLERVLLAEAVAGALADALAPALAGALAPRILQLMEDGAEEDQPRRTPARSAKSGK
ncbi:hypothetical protein Dvina_35060 [Dactylosporangium vinaceum]|uniref:Uncharacterized protein n=1 Tax=Dactylosporangium vinaceum TaxID=53362 RepID=A0ABV5M446_9ACTN|nr:hypothetical protein [Dactylosporangium vinaceum]UAB93449.1 hypothetical protein Dvina_35060 [Dactylosporangium vinaceum]